MCISKKKIFIHFLKKSEFLISIYSSVAQAESESISSNQKCSIQKRFMNGTYILPNPAYGYCTNTNGLLELNQKQAAVVRFIFDEYLEGNGIWRIAKSLNEQRIPTKTGKAAWLGGAIYIILKNNINTGDLLLQKTYSEDIVPFVRRKNNGEYRQVLIENDHEPIVTHEEYEAVQRMLKQKAKVKKPAKKNSRKNLQSLKEKLSVASAVPHTIVGREKKEQVRSILLGAVPDAYRQKNFVRMT